MLASHQTRRRALKRLANGKAPILATILTIMAVVGGVTAGNGTAAATTGNRVDMRVLVLNDGGSNTTAIATALDREGVPMASINIAAAVRPAITAADLENAATHEGYFQAIVLAAPTSVTPAELAVLASYERRYGVRQVDSFAFPSATVGLSAPAYTGTLDGSTVTATAAALSGPFSYLAGSMKIDDVSAAIPEVFGYAASPLTGLPAGQSVTPLLNVTAGGATGSLVSSYTHDGHDELVITSAFNANQQYFLQLAHGIITWATRGVHLGYQRNAFSLEVDDVFLPDSRWSSVGHCTPGDDCFGANSTLTTPDIRMTAADVTSLVAWQKANGFALDMIFNGGGSADYVAANPTGDPVAAAFAANASNFTFINHTYSHAFLGCIQVAPAVAGQTWHCATAADEANPSTVYIDPTLVTATGQTLDPATGVYYASKATIESQIAQNITWAASHGIPIDSTQVVTGEHSGLAVLPQQPVDNPFLASALTDLGITALASDASRETTSRTVGPATTAPRHPMNIFYNVSSYADEVNEYNYLYSSVADGGSGVCTAHPDTTTCITPLPNATPAQSQNSFDTYIRPTEVHNALSFILANDPRSFYVHQANLTDNRIIYPVLTDILGAYRAVYNANAPLVHLDLHGQASALGQMTAWKSQSGQTTAYLDAAGVHVQGAGSAAVPLTVPTGTTLNGISLNSYGGEKSGWISQPATDTVVAVPTTTNGGFVGVPDAPTIGVATGGNASAVIAWSAPARDNGSPITGYRIQGFLAGQSVASVTVTAPVTATTATVTGLLNFASYTFSVSAVNAVGTSDQSALSNAVIPVAVAPAAPAAPTAVAGNQSATISWVAPNNGGTPITGYTVKAYVVGATVWAASTTALASDTSATMTGLTNGTSYTFTVTAANAIGNGAESAQSNAVIPATVSAAPTIGTATPGVGSASVTWTAPTSTGGSPVTSYTIRGYAAGAAAPSVTATAAGTALSVTVTGLTSGVSYTFDVVAVTAAGAGAASAKSNTVVPTGLPSAPALTGVSLGNLSATVTWTAPANSGGLPITSYAVRRYASSGTVQQTLIVAGTVRSATFALAAGSTASFDVAAVNAAGTGSASTRSAVVTALSAPTAPIIGLATSTRSGAVVRWSAPASTGGTPVTGYIVRTVSYSLFGRVLSTVDSAVQPAASRSLTLNIRPGLYRFSVVATNAVASSPSSAQSNLILAL